METRARYALIGLFMLAVIAASFAFVYWLENKGGFTQRDVYQVRYEGSVSGLLPGSAVLFNGIRVGEVTHLSLNPQAPQQVVATIAVDRNTPIARVATMDELMSRTASERQFASAIYAVFAIAALLLTAVGLYGVISGRVAERTREIGIRTALGATRGAIVRGVLARGLLLTVAGIVIGVAGAAATSRLLETLLYGISRADLVTYAFVIILLSGVALLACWAPARRAAAVDPAVTLRVD